MIMMKPISRTLLIVLVLASAMPLASCYVTPIGGVGATRWRAQSPFSPGGAAVLPRETHPRSPYSPGGIAVLPREARRVMHRGTPYWMHGNTCYAHRGGRYVVVPRPW